MIDKYILNRQGHPEKCPDVLAWGRWFETADRIVEVTHISDDVRVSTVFLGLDHGFGARSRPVLWETLVFGGPLNDEMYRYENRLQAVRGHWEMVAKVREALDDQPTRQIELE